jgi:predicted site-specific integrase-resolvase
MMPDALGLSEPEAARVIGVHPDTLKRWRRRGAVGFVLTPGGRIRYTTEQLHQLRAAMRVDAQLGKKL